MSLGHKVRMLYWHIILPVTFKGMNDPCMEGGP